MSKRRRRVLVFCGVLCVLAGFVPWPEPISDRLAPRVVAHAVRAVVNDRRVFTEGAYRPLNESHALEPGARIHFINELGVPDSAFTRLGLLPVPTGERVVTGPQSVLVTFSRTSYEEGQIHHIQFSYRFGDLAAYGYEIRSYRSLFRRYFVYRQTWMS